MFQSILAEDTFKYDYDTYHNHKNHLSFIVFRKNIFDFSERLKFRKFLNKSL
jgi:hypothetical protein